MKAWLPPRWLKPGCWWRSSIPRQVRKFAGAIGRLAKTDAIDAAVIAHFAQAVRHPYGRCPMTSRRGSPN
jgi:hypothetical protein